MGANHGTRRYKKKKARRLGAVGGTLPWLSPKWFRVIRTLTALAVLVLARATAAGPFGCGGRGDDPYDVAGRSYCQVER